MQIVFYVFNKTNKNIKRTSVFVFSRGNVGKISIYSCCRAVPRQRVREMLRLCVWVSSDLQYRCETNALRGGLFNNAHLCKSSPQLVERTSTTEGESVTRFSPSYRCGLAMQRQSFHRWSQFPLSDGIALQFKLASCWDSHIGFLLHPCRFLQTLSMKQNHM